MTATLRFPLTAGPRTFDADRKTAFFRSGTSRILLVVERAKPQEDGSIVFFGHTKMRGFPEPRAVARFSPATQTGSIEYP